MKIGDTKNLKNEFYFRFHINGSASINFTNLVTLFFPFFNVIINLHLRHLNLKESVRKMFLAMSKRSFKMEVASAPSP